MGSKDKVVDVLSPLCGWTNGKDKQDLGAMLGLLCELQAKRLGRVVATSPGRIKQPSSGNNRGLTTLCQLSVSPGIYRTPIDSLEQAQEAIVRTNQLSDLHELSMDIRFAVERSDHYYNQHRSVESTLEEIDIVYILRRKIQTQRPSGKLDLQEAGTVQDVTRQAGVISNGAWID